MDATGTPTVTFANYAYTPKCLTITAGQTVTFSGSFAAHPLAPGILGSATAGSPNNPIVETKTGTSKTFTFPTAGTYPYYCEFHAASKMMFGSIHVK